MPPKKNKTNRGRPPRYVLDDKGKEVVGLSYNPTNRMYYATSSSPRHYFKIGNVRESDRKKEAIRLFREWNKSQQLTTEEVFQDPVREDEILIRARRMIDEGFYNDLIEDKAKELIKDDAYVNEELIKRAYGLLTNNLSQFNVSRYSIKFTKIEKEIESILNSLAIELLRKNIEYGTYDSSIAERFQRIIRESRFEAARLLKMPFLIFLSEAESYVKNSCMIWDELWIVFTVIKKPDQYLFQEDWYKAVSNNISWILKGKTINKITYDEFKDAYNRIADLEDYFYEKDSEIPFVERDGKRHSPKDSYLNLFKCLCSKDPNYHPFDDINQEYKNNSKIYLSINHIDRIKILEDIVLTVQNSGFTQADNIIEHIKTIS